MTAVRSEARRGARRSVVGAIAACLALTTVGVAGPTFGQAPSGGDTTSAAPGSARRRAAPNAAVAPEAAPTAPAAERPDPVEGVVNLNDATEAELVKLPGIGPTRARAILALRERRGGRFERVEDLLQVRGVGRSTFRRIRPHLALEGPTTLRAR